MLFKLVRVHLQCICLAAYILCNLQQCSELHVRHYFWSVWTADTAFLRGFGPTVSSGLYPIRKCPQSGPRTWGLGGGLDRLNHRPLATSAADPSAIRNTGLHPWFERIPIGGG